MDRSTWDSAAKLTIASNAFADEFFYSRRIGYVSSDEMVTSGMGKIGEVF